MGARNFLGKAVYWTAVVPCIFSIGSSASVSLCYQPVKTIHGGYVGIIDLDTTDSSRGFLYNPLAARLEKIECLTSAQGTRHTPHNINEQVSAGWYGPEHHNKLTASGQRFDMHKNTLAHRILPLGTKVRLVNPDNGKSTEGVVNDRGPYIKGRDVDVSYAMAAQLGFVKKGVTKLEMETISAVGKHTNGIEKKYSMLSMPVASSNAHVMRRH